MFECCFAVAASMGSMSPARMDRVFLSRWLCGSLREEPCMIMLVNMRKLPWNESMFSTLRPRR